MNGDDVPESPTANTGLSLPCASSWSTVSWPQGVVVPTPTISVAVVSLTTVPSSVHPPADERVVAPHTIAPVESIMRPLVPEHSAWLVCKALVNIPPLNVDVPDPEIVKALVIAR